MKIIYQPNPLTSRVELDDADRRYLRLRLRIEHLEELLSDAAFHLKDDKYFDLERVRKNTDWDQWSWSDKGTTHMEKEVERRFTWACQELEEGYHCGDCTCVPASCSKCWAEDLLGVNTIKGLHKHQAHKIDCAFRDGATTIDEVIEVLERYNPQKNDSWLKSDPDGKVWDAHLPRWKTEAASALKWIKKYRDDYFPVDRCDELREALSEENTNDDN